MSGLPRACQIGHGVVALARPGGEAFRVENRDVAVMDADETGGLQLARRPADARARHPRTCAIQSCVTSRVSAAV